MKSRKNKLIKDLDYIHGIYSSTLVPHPIFKDKFMAPNLYFNNHQELVNTSRALIYLAMRTIDPEFGNDDILGRNEDDYVRQALTIVNRLTLAGDEAYLDVFNNYYNDKNST